MSNVGSGKTHSEPTLDARTLDAMRVMVACWGDPKPGSTEWHTRIEASAVQIRSFVQQHDASTAAARDEDLISAMLTEWYEAETALSELSPNLRADWKRVARAARAHIAKEQAQ